MEQRMNNIQELFIENKFDLGKFRAGTVNTYRFTVNMPEDSLIEYDIDGINIFPERLVKGDNLITVTTEPIRDGITLFGELIFRSTDVRKAYLVGSSSESAAVHTDSSASAFRNQQPSVKDIPESAAPPQSADMNLMILKKGQRLSLSDTVNNSIKIQLVFDYLEKQIDIDGYVFLLNKSGKVSKDEDMIFWGNKISEDKSIKLHETAEQPYFSVLLTEVSPDTTKIAVCYSIYGDDLTETFKLVKNPRIRIIADNVSGYEFQLRDLKYEKTIVAAELYRYNGEWKINCIGSGYNAGLRRLCEDYGVEIED